MRNSARGAVPRAEQAGRRTVIRPVKMNFTHASGAVDPPDVGPPNGWKAKRRLNLIYTLVKGPESGYLWEGGRMQNNPTQRTSSSRPIPGGNPVPEGHGGGYGEPGFGEAQKVSLSSDPRLHLLSIVINFLVVSELFIAMYFASRNPDALTPTFFTVFFSLLIPTIIGAVIGRRLIARAGP